MTPPAGTHPARRPHPLGLALALAAALAALLGWSAWAADRDALVVYCAHDSLYSEAVLADFTRQTGIEVDVRYDTEATKSLGLVELISRERAAPRCDVFWNNEVLGTMRLAAEGLLEPYQGAGFRRIPPRFRDAAGRWAGFAARLRVWIVHTGMLPATQAAIAEHVRTGLAVGDLGRVAVAKPLYGTTRTHYTLLWHLQGGKAVERWHRQWRAAGVREVPGNRHVKDLVAAGHCQLGLTDTDDYFLALDAGEPVAMAPVLLEPDRAICIPNSVAIVRGTTRLQRSRQLVDHLLSAAVEIALARSPARQIPLGAVAAQDLPDEVQLLQRLVPDACDLAGIDDARRACLGWLRLEYLR